MMMTISRIQCLLIATCVMGLMTGCASNRLLEERNALYEQNQELQERLTQANLALESRDVELARLRAAMQTRPAPVAPAKAVELTEIPGVETIASSGALTFRVQGDVLFSSGQVTLKDAAKQTLDEVARVIKRDYKGKEVRVVGYTDTDPIKKSKWKDNLELSQQRAGAVHRFLQGAGLEPKLLETVGRGEWHPRSSKKLSRRVEIVVVLPN